MSKNAIIITVIAIVAVAVGGYFIFSSGSSTTQPAFSVVPGLLPHSGTYTFGSSSGNPYGSAVPAIGITQPGGWTVQTSVLGDGSTKFDLMQNGALVKTLQTV